MDTMRSRTCILTLLVVVTHHASSYVLLGVLTVLAVGFTPCRWVGGDYVDVVAMKDGRSEEGIRLLEEAVRAEDLTHYDEPSDWAYPARHVLGAALLKAGRTYEAELVYRADLERNRENGWALFGLAESLKKQGKNEEAAAVQKRFAKAWAGADVKIAASSY